MAGYYNTDTQFKSYYIPDRIGPGALGNSQVKMCKYCSQNGFHNEPIIFRKYKGKWHPINYFDGTYHEHKYQRTQQIDT